jgi:sialate O-acetylesterase
MATLAPVSASAQPADLVVQGHNTVTLHDVVVGEVWLCSGQSNMEFTVDDGGFTYRVRDAEAELAAANYPLIRQIKVERTVAMAPARTVKTSGWTAATPQTVRGFTAVGYFFARDIHRAIGVPVGIIDSPWGGTPIESWMSDEARRSTSLSEWRNTRLTLRPGTRPRGSQPRRTRAIPCPGPSPRPRTTPNTIPAASTTG